MRRYGRVAQIRGNAFGEVVVRRSGSKLRRKPDRFDAVRGKAQIRWKTDELMALLRG